MPLRFPALGLLLLGACATAYAPDRPAPEAPLLLPAPDREFRGAWVASVANIDWPSRPGLSTAQQQAELLALLDQAAGLNLNAVIFQVRPAADALYASPHEPWSEYLTGRMGRAPEPFYDPLAFAVEEAHRRGLELHAWFNPYRARHPTARSEPSPDHVSRTHPEIVRAYGRSLWLDPGEEEARLHALRVILDVVRRYDVDGIHLDDYFYPYPEKNTAGRPIPFPDEASWARAVAAGTTLSRENWRRQNVDRFVESLYREIKREKPWVKVGISPFGIWRPGHPASIKGLDAYAELYADARKWLAYGWLDYFSPQLYWRIDQASQSYPVLLDWWQAQNTRGRHLWPGNFTSRVGAGAGEPRWPPGEILDQIRLTRAQPGATGNVHFSMQALARNREGLADRLRAEAYARPALVPASPWLSQAPPPGAPDVRFERGALVLRPARGEAAWLWVVRARYGEAWTLEVVPGRTRAHPLAHPGVPDLAAVSVVDRLGNEGPATLLRPTNR